MAKKIKVVQMLADRLAITVEEAGALKKKYDEAMLEVLIDEGRFEIAGLGAFNLKDREARMGRNPRTGEPVPIAATKAVTFRASSSLKDRLKEIRAEEINTIA